MISTEYVGTVPEGRKTHVMNLEATVSLSFLRTVAIDSWNVT